MPTDGQLPVSCPHCHNNLASLTVRSFTILTMTCANCGYTWAVELAAMPGIVRAAAQRVDRDTTH